MPQRSGFLPTSATPAIGLRARLLSKEVWPARCPARGSEAATSPGLGSPRVSAKIRTSLITSLVFFDNPADLRQLLCRRAFCRKRLYDQPAHGAFEDSIQYVRDDLSLRLLLRNARFIHVGVRRVVSADQSFLNHDLHELQHCRVTRFLRLVEHVLDLPHRARPAIPQDAQNRQLRVRWFWRF